MTKFFGGYVYILTNKWNKVLYVGECVDLVKRIYEHREKTTESWF